MPAGAQGVSMDRREWLAAGSVALLAGAAGLGAALWWRDGEAGPDDTVAEAFWRTRWDNLQGQAQPVDGWRGRPLILNFWATWCPPCVEEMPMLDAFYQAQRARGWQVLGLAIDQPSAVRRFMQRTPVTYPVLLAGLEGSEWTRCLGNAQGGLPFTVVFGARGQVAARKLGQVKPADLQAWRETISTA